MTLEEAYRHIKESYLHHSRERNAVFLPQAELITMECIQRMIDKEKAKQCDIDHDYVIGDVYILLDDLNMCNDNYGIRTGGGTAKAGQRFKLLDLPDCNKRMYTLLPLGVKFPYHL